MGSPVLPRSKSRAAFARDSGHKDGRSFEPTGAQIGEGAVGLGERIGRRASDDADLGGDAQEIESVLSREVATDASCRSPHRIR
jgi:hypothetical protein